MDKGTAAKLLAEGQTNEDDAIQLGTVESSIPSMYENRADYPGPKF